MKIGTTRVGRMAFGAAAMAALVSAPGVMADEAESSQDCVAAIGGQNVDGEGTFTWTGPQSSWPPNHKDVAASITLTDDDAEPATDDVVLTVVGTHDEQIVEGSELGEENGAGNTNPATDATGGTADGTGSATVPVTFRAERAGTGDGRTYTFTATGTLDNGLTMCEPVTFVVSIPHDQGNRPSD
jgi:hypothetical protein